MALYFIGLNPLVPLIGLAVLVMLIQNRDRSLRHSQSTSLAVGQFAPGPVFTSATFIGYILGGVPGAVVATLGIFLPSFVFVALVYLLVPRWRASPWMRAFLDGVDAAAGGLMAAPWPGSWHSPASSVR